MSKRLTPDELRSLRETDFANQPDFVRAEDVLAPEIGVIGSDERKEFDAKAWCWYEKEFNQKLTYGKDTE